MTNQPMSAVSVRLLLPETLWLEPEHFEQARAISHASNNEPEQWQAYLNALAMLAFETWLQERLPNQPVQQSSHAMATMGYLNVGAFSLGLLATEQVLDERISLPRATIEQPDVAASFYIVLEVLEDQEQVIIRGFLRHDELVTHYNRIASLVPQSEWYPIPLSIFDAEINHLVFYVQHSEPHTMPLPMAAMPSIAPPLQININQIRTHLSQWLEGVLGEGWQTIDRLINPEANLAWSTRQTDLSTRGGKLINFGMQLGNQTVALLVTVTPERDGKVGIGIQVLPAGGVQILPIGLKLTLLSHTDELLQTVESRAQDNYIQLKPFKGRPGINFSIDVSLNDIKVRETFAL